MIAADGLVVLALAALATAAMVGVLLWDLARARRVARPRRRVAAMTGNSDG